MTAGDGGSVNEEFDFPKFKSCPLYLTALESNLSSPGLSFLSL